VHGRALAGAIANISSNSQALFQNSAASANSRRRGGSETATVIAFEIEYGYFGKRNLPYDKSLRGWTNGNH
jgi:hypothetical protein